jgi:hypothetical protein
MRLEAFPSQEGTSPLAGGHSRQALWGDGERRPAARKPWKEQEKGIKREAALAYAFPLSPALHHRPQSLPHSAKYCPRGRSSTLKPRP